jgi:hypothetical protein
MQFGMSRPPNVRWEQAASKVLVMVRLYVSGLVSPHIYPSAMYPNPCVLFEYITSTSTQYRSTILEHYFIHQAIIEPIVDLVDFQAVFIVVLKVVLKVILVLVLAV